MLNLYYSAIAIIAAIIHMIIGHSYYIHKDSSPEIRNYKRFLAVVFCYYLTDAAWGVLSAYHITRLLYIDTILYYVAMALSVVLCCRYIVTFLKLRRSVGRMMNLICVVFALSEGVVLIINHFHHIFFWFDEAGNYQAYMLRHVFLVLQVIIFSAISIVSLFVVLTKESDVARRNLTICIYGFCMTFALIAQALYPLLPLYTIGLILGTLVIHVFIHNEEIHSHLVQIKALNAALKQEQKELQKQKDEISTSYAIINGLSHDFHSIWWANKEDMKIHMVRAAGKGLIQDALKIGLGDYDCNVAVQYYIDRFVVPEERERLRRQVNADVVLEQLSQKDFYAVNYTRMLADGQVDYNQMAFANAINGEGREILVFGFRDVNDILRQELALRQEISEAKEAAEAANAAKTSFLFNMSHDIRTPMNAIIGFRDLLEKNQEDAEKRESYLHKIEESSNVLLSIINNVLEMARIEKGVLQLDESAWSAEQMNDTMYSVFDEMMRQKGLQFTREIDVQHHYVFCDPTKTREIFINIISNAYKYTKPGGKIHMKLKELPSDREGYAKYQTTISDTGIGMSEDFLPHIFEEFSRELNSTHSKIEGTGLGMPIVKRLVDFLGGTIQVESQKGVGTTFTVELYHRIAESSAVKQVEAEISPAAFDGRRILLAEDNELNAEIAQEVLSAIGFEIERAVDGQDCVDKLCQADANHYDLILMDIQMPRMNGYEATRAIRALEDQDKAHITILAMTANAFEEDKREAFKAGMNGHLAKPINVRELTKALAAAIKK